MTEKIIREMPDGYVDVIGWDSLYKINSDGVYSIKSGKVLKFSINMHGYKVVTLSCNYDNKKILFHRLIAKHFIPNPENKPEVNHINGNKLDNRIENLEWATRIENMQHARKMGLFKNESHGSKSHFSVLSEADVVRIRGLLSNKVDIKLIAKEYKMDTDSIYNIKNRKSWKHI